MSIAERLKKSLGVITFLALKKWLKNIQISFEENNLIIYRDNQKPEIIAIKDIEEFVNSVN